MSSVATSPDDKGSAMEADGREPVQLPEGSLVKYPALRGVSLVFVVMAVMLHTIDSTIANVALPHLRGEMAATVDQISWVITGYIIAAAIATPCVAWVSERFGTKRIFLIAIIAFTLSSVLCGLAMSLGDLVAYRILQGFSGAALIPLGQAVMMSTFEKEDYPKAMGLFGFGVMLGPIIAPTLGGYIIEIASWRWVFFINLPIGIVSALGVWLMLKEAPLKKDIRFDGFGYLTLVIAIGCFQLMMDRGQGEDWFESEEIFMWLIISALGFYYYTARTMSSDAPLFKRDLFVDRNFILGNILFFIIMGNMIATMVLLPNLMQSVMGYPVIHSGILLAPRGIGMMIAMVAAPRIAQRVNPKVLSAIGILIAAVALYDQSRVSIHFTDIDFIRAGFWHGMGLGLVFGQLGAMSFSTIADELRLEATTVFNITRNVGASVCASISMTVLARNMQVNSANLGENITPLNQAMELSPFSLHGGAVDEVTLTLLSGTVSKQAAILAYGANFFSLSVLCFLSTFLLMLLKPVPRETSE
jgi:DHA2 family multidrug resistance protein